jgi:nitrite reductase (NO-forming)
MATTLAVSLATALASLGLSAATASAARAPTKVEQMQAGKAVYAATCAACHQPDGTGVKGEVPPLAGSDFLAKGHEHAIAVVLHGLKGTLKVHGRKYDSAMPPQMYRLTNEEVADVLTFVYNSWGNPGGQVHASDVAAQRYDRTLAPEAN